MRRVFSRPRRHTSARPRRRQLRPTLQLLEDRVVPSDFVVVSAADHGHGTLRACIFAVNADTSDSVTNPDTISFNIQGSGIETISPTSALPVITRPVIIDGYPHPGQPGQPGAHPNTLSTGDNANILITLDGSLAPGYVNGAGTPGLWLATNNSVIRGLRISSFSGDGIDLEGNNNLVQGNFLIGNYRGVLVGGQTNLIGTNGDGVNDPGERNVIFGSIRDGITIVGGQGDMVAGNYIGTDGNGNGGLQTSNGGAGVLIYHGAQNNVVGANLALPNINIKAFANIIAFNEGGGVVVEGADSTGNRIEANSIYHNQGLDIDLGGDGVTLNTPGGPHTGPNNLQNFPTITSASPGLGTVINCTLNGAPYAAYTIDFYASPLPGLDTFGGETYGGGQRWLGSVSGNTDSLGNALFSSGLLPAATNANDWVTATATDAAGNTSEFSIACQLPVVPLNADSWIPIGPASSYGTGRVDDAVPDPNNPNVMYVAAMDGGIWKTSNWLDPYPAWTPLTDVPLIPSQSISIHEHDLVVVPGDRTTIFAAASGPGGGILRSTDDGDTWVFLANNQFDMAEFGALVADPNVPKGQTFPTLYAAVSGGAVDGGVYQSTDGGANWINMTPPTPSSPPSLVFPDAQGPVSDLLAMQEDGQTVLYGAFTGDGVVSGIYKSYNGFKSSSLLDNGLPIGSAVGEAVRLAGGGIMPNESVYATIVDPSYSTTTRYRSDNAGTWLPLPGITKKDTNGQTVSNEDSPAISGYASHVFRHMLLTVDPLHPMTVLASGAGGVYESLLGGNDWKLLYADDPTSGTFDFASKRGFAACGDNGIMRVTGDPGIDGVVQQSPTVITKDGNLSTVQFYTFSLDPTNAPAGYGNAQDYPGVLPYTGTHVWGYQQPFYQNTGEAGEVRVNHSGVVYYFDPNAGTRFQYLPKGATNWQPATTGLPEVPSNGNEITQKGFYGAHDGFVMDPNNEMRMFLGLNSVFETTTGGDANSADPLYQNQGWRDTGLDLVDNGQAVTAIAIDPSDRETIYAGTIDGHIYVTNSDGMPPAPGQPGWHEADLGLPLNNETVWDIKLDPTGTGTQQLAYAVTSPWVDRDAKAADLRAHPHVWMTLNGGATWSPAEYPSTPWNATTPLPREVGGESLAVDWGSSPVAIYVGTLRGVWKTTDNGEHWTQDLSVPNTIVTDLDLEPKLNLLGAATLGRGAYEILLGAPAPSSSSMSPTSTVSSSPSLVLTVNGSNFVGNSSVQVNGRPVRTTFVNTGQLQATIDSSFFKAPGTLKITVFTPGPGGGTSNPLRLTVIPTPLPASFAARAGGPLNDSGQSIAADAAGNVYVAGNVAGTQSAIDTDIYVAKYYANGTPAWHLQIGGPYGDSANAIAVDQAGNSYVTGDFGDFNGHVAFGNFTLNCAVGQIDGFVMKVDTNGNVVWVHQFTNPGGGTFGPPIYQRLGTTAPKGIALDNQGNVVVCGTFAGEMDLDPTHPGQHVVSSVGHNVHPIGYVVKLDPNGNFVWEAQAVNPVDDINVFSIAVDARNEIYVLGNFANQNWLNDKTANNSNQRNGHSLHLNGPNVTALYVWKLHADGTNDTVYHTIESSPQNQNIWGLGIAVDRKGDIYITGSFEGTAKVNFDPLHAPYQGDPFVIASPGGNYDTFIAKMYNNNANVNLNGKVAWVNQIKSNGDNWGTGLALDAAGHPYVTGYLTANAQLGARTHLTSVSPEGNTYYTELDPLTGGFEFVRTSVDLAPSGDQGAAIAVDSQGFVVITGTFGAHMKWPGLPPLASAGHADIFIVQVKNPI
jgi:hypothetical protein